MGLDMGAVGQGLNFLGFIGSQLAQRKLGKAVDEMGPVSGTRPGGQTSNPFPGAGIAPPGGALGNRIRESTGINFSGGNITERDIGFINDRLNRSDPSLADDFNRFVTSSVGGIPIDPDTRQVIEAGGRDLDTLQRISSEDLERQFQALGQASDAVSGGIRGQKNALRRREANLMSQMNGMLRKGAADVRLAQATAFLPVVLMKQLRDESLSKFSDNSVAEMDMVSGAMAARHNQEAEDLKAQLSAQGMQKEFIEASVQELRSDQKSQITDQLTSVRIKHQQMKQDLDLQTQQFVGFAAQTAAEQTTRIADINRGITQMGLSMVRDTQMDLLRTDLAIREKEMDGEILVADMLRGIKEMFVSESEFVEGAFGINSAQEDRELQRLAMRHGIDINRFNQITAFGTNLTNQELQREQIEATEKAGDQAFIGGLASGGLGVAGSFFGSQGFANLTAGKGK